MSKIKIKKFISDLKKLAERRTVYNCVYPYNCGYIWPAGQMSFDCINMIKSYINEPGIVTRTKPKGYFVKPGQVIPDTTVDGILALCTGRSKDFTVMWPGAYMVYNGHGHGSIYVGDFKHGGKTYNTIECTSDFGGGVVRSYTDVKTGGRYQFKGSGACYGYYIGYGYLSRYIDYAGNTPPKKLQEQKTDPKPAAKKKSITTIANEVIAGKWSVYPERKKLLEAAGYDYAKVQAKVDSILKKK